MAVVLENFYGYYYCCPLCEFSKSKTFHELAFMEFVAEYTIHEWILSFLIQRSNSEIGGLIS